MNTKELSIDQIQYILCMKMCFDVFHFIDLDFLSAMIHNLPVPSLHMITVHTLYVYSKL